MPYHKYSRADVYMKLAVPSLASRQRADSDSEGCLDPLLQKDKGQLNSKLLLSTKEQVHKLGQTNQYFRGKINSRRVYRQVQEGKRIS